MKKIETIIYDLDGTLIDTNDIIIRSFRSTFEKFEPNTKMPLEKIQTFIGPPLGSTFRNYTNDPFKIQEMIDTYRKHYIENEKDNFHLYPGVLTTLKKLKQLGYKLAILTSKTKDAATPSFTKTGLSNYFDLFVCVDDVKNAKPHKDAVNHVLKQLKSSKNAIMIGDNQGDILAGKNADIYSAGVAWALKGSLHLKEAKPDFILEDMNDIFNIIKKIEGEN